MRSEKVRRATSLSAWLSSPSKALHALRATRDPSAAADRKHRESRGAPFGINPPRRMRDVLVRYGLALVLVALALALLAALPLKEGTGIYQLPLAAVVLTAWYGGRGPGLFASLLSATGVLYLFAPPRYSFELSPDYALTFFIFVPLCLLLSQFSAGRRGIEQALRASEERFRTLVQFSFDVYWETDAQHRFTRQEFSERRAQRADARRRARQDPLGDSVSRARRRGLAQASRHARCAPSVPGLRDRSPNRRGRRALHLRLRHSVIR